MSAPARACAHVRADVPQPSGPYSHTIELGDLVLTSGFGPHDPVTGEVPAGIAAQTEQVLDHVETCLASHGLGLDDVVRVTAHLSDLERDVAAYNEVMARRFAAPYPVRTTVGSRFLGFLVELDVIAVRPRSAR